MRVALCVCILSILINFSVLSTVEAGEGNRYISEAIDAAEQGNCSRAFSLLDEAKKIRSKDFTTYFVIGTTYVRCNNPEQAKQYFKKGLKLAKQMSVQDEYIKGNMAVSYAFLGEFRNAKILAEEAKILFIKSGDTKRANDMNRLILSLQNR
ncbi:MAG: hypothetical protein VB032_08760 [Burkholderiaceae bacterium]|nr:hypothetical protein [Burkholderiaceae bacterium]